MFVTNHVLAGAVVGTACRRRPGLALLAGFASHVAMDLVPHWGDDALDDAGFYEVARRDGLLGLAVLTGALATGAPPRRALVAGIVGAVALDLDKPCQYLLGLDPFPSWLSRFHGRIQHEAPHRVPHEVAAGVGLAAAARRALTRQRRADV